VSARLERVEEIIDASAITKRIELLLPAGVRPRQLKARTLLIGMTLTMLDGRDALLTGVHKTLLALPREALLRLGVTAHWKTGPHTLTYRQLEYTYRLISKTLAKDKPDGTPSELLSEVLDRLVEASVQVLGEPASSSYAVDWTAHETWSRPPGVSEEPCRAGRKDWSCLHLQHLVLITMHPSVVRMTMSSVVMATRATCATSGVGRCRGFRAGGRPASLSLRSPMWCWISCSPARARRRRSRARMGCWRISPAAC
jgi:hypothetical protein